MPEGPNAFLNDKLMLSDNFPADLSSSPRVFKPLQTSAKLQTSPKRRTVQSSSLVTLQLEADCVFAAADVVPHAKLVDTRAKVITHARSVLFLGYQAVQCTSFQGFSLKRGYKVTGPILQSYYSLQGKNARRGDSLSVTNVSESQAPPLTELCTVLYKIARD